MRVEICVSVRGPIMAFSNWEQRDLWLIPGATLKTWSSSCWKRGMDMQVEMQVLGRLCECYSCSQCPKNRESLLQVSLQQRQSLQRTGQLLTCQFLQGHWARRWAGFPCPLANVPVVGACLSLYPLDTPASSQKSVQHQGYVAYCSGGLDPHLPALLLTYRVINEWVRLTISWQLFS